MKITYTVIAPHVPNDTENTYTFSKQLEVNNAYEMMSHMLTECKNLCDKAERYYAEMAMIGIMMCIQMNMDPIEAFDTDLSHWEISVTCDEHPELNTRKTLHVGVMDYASSKDNCIYNMLKDFNQDISSAFWNVLPRGTVEDKLNGLMYALNNNINHRKEEEDNHKDEHEKPSDGMSDIVSKLFGNKPIEEEPKKQEEEPKKQEVNLEGLDVGKILSQLFSSKE